MASLFIWYGWAVVLYPWGWIIIVVDDDDLDITWWWWWDGVHIFDVNGCGGYLVEPYCIQDTSVTLWEAGYPHLDIPIYRQRPKDFVLGNCWDVEIVTSFLTFGYIQSSKESKDLILGCINEGFMQGCFLNTLHIYNFDPCSLNIAQRPLAFLKSVAIEIANAGYFPFYFPVLLWEWNLIKNHFWNHLTNTFKYKKIISHFLRSMMGLML